MIGGPAASLSAVVGLIVLACTTVAASGQQQCSTGQQLLGQGVCSTTVGGQYQCLARTGQQLVDALTLYGSSGKDTVIQVQPLHGTILDLAEGQVQFKQACRRPDNSDPYSSGFVTIMANTTSTNELDMVVVNTQMRANITEQLSGSARLKLFNLGWVNLCELVVPMNDKGSLNYISSLDMGLFPRQHTHQTHVYDSITIFGTYVDMATQLYISLVQRTAFPKVRELVQELVMNLPDWQAVYSEITTCMHRAISFSMPSAKVYNSTFIAVEDPDDPVLLGLRKAGKLLWPLFCNGTAIPASHVKADVTPDVGPLFRASNTAEWGPALFNATQLTEEQVARGRVPVAIMLLGSAVMDPALLPGPLQVHGPMLMWGPIYNDPNNIMFATLDWAERDAVLHLRPGAQLFVQQMVFTNLPLRQLPAVQGSHAIAGFTSVFPLAGISSEAGQETWPVDPPVQMHSCELVIPREDYLALMSLAFVNRTAYMHRCLDPAIIERAAALQRGIYGLELSMVDPALQAFVVNMVGWGLNITDGCIRAAAPIDSAPLTQCLASAAAEAQAASVVSGGVPVVGVVLGSVVAGTLLLVLLLIVGLMAWQRWMVRSRQLPPSGSAALAAAKVLSHASTASSTSHMVHSLEGRRVKGSGAHTSVHVASTPASKHRASLGSDGTPSHASSHNTVASTASGHRSSGDGGRPLPLPLALPVVPQSSLYLLVQHAEQLQVSRTVCSAQHVFPRRAKEVRDASHATSSSAGSSAGPQPQQGAAGEILPTPPSSSNGAVATPTPAQALRQVVCDAASQLQVPMPLVAAGAVSQGAARAGSRSGAAAEGPRTMEAMRAVSSDSDMLQPPQEATPGSAATSDDARAAAPIVYSDPSLMHSQHQAGQAGHGPAHGEGGAQPTQGQPPPQPPDQLQQTQQQAQQQAQPQQQQQHAQQQQPQQQRSHMLLCSALGQGAAKGRLDAADYIQLIASKAGHLGNADQVVVRGVLGRGSWGTVYEGEWRGLPVAVKTMVFELPDDAVALMAGDASVVVPQHTRAIMEAAIAASVGHRNLVCTYKYDIKRVNVRHGDSVGGLQIEEAFEQGAGPTTSSPGHSEYKLFLIQELCGTTLAHALTQQALYDTTTGYVHEALVLHLLLDVAQGLDYLHCKNIIHGDLKPANVLLKTEASHPIGVTAKLADFGLSSHLPEGATHVSNFTSGTPFYVAPEVVQQRRTSTASDIYSLGIIMWQLYSGGTPFLQDAEGRYMANPNFGKFELPRVPHPIYIQLMHRCLHTSPRLRPTAEQVGAVLCGLLGLGSPSSPS